MTRASAIAVANMQALLSTGSRLNQSAVYAVAADTYQIYAIPANSIVTKVFFIVDEVFDDGTTIEVKTISGTPVTLVAALSGTTAAASVSTVVDKYMPVVDGFAIKFNQDITKGVVRVIAEYLSLDESTGAYVAQGA